MDGLEREEYALYWETKVFLEAEELKASLALELDAVLPNCFEPISTVLADNTANSTESKVDADDTRSLDEGGSTSSTTSKNALMERKKRRSLTDKLYALRSLVPNISKMDKISIIKDAINYIVQLQDEERKILEESPEISENGTRQDPTRRKRRRTVRGSEASWPSIQAMELHVSEVGKGTSLVSMACHKKGDTMARVGEVFESLNLKIISGNFASFNGRLVHNLLVQTDGMQPARLKEKIELAIAQLDAPEITTNF